MTTKSRRSPVAVLAVMALLLSACQPAISFLAPTPSATATNIPSNTPAPARNCKTKGSTWTSRPMPRSCSTFERVDDVSSTAYWYQTLPTLPFPKFPDKALRSLGL